MLAFRDVVIPEGADGRRRLLVLLVSGLGIILLAFPLLLGAALLPFGSLAVLVGSTLLLFFGILRLLQA